MPVTITVLGLRSRLTLDAPDAVAQMILDAATEIVEKYAGPDTPESILNEAATRVVGWLMESNGGSWASHETAEVKIALATGQKSALRHSGARSLLNPWKVRGAVLIAEDD